MLQNNFKKNSVIFFAATTVFFTMLSGAFAQTNRIISYNYLCQGEHHVKEDMLLHRVKEDMLLLQDTSSTNAYILVKLGKTVMQYVPIDHDPAHNTNDGLEVFAAPETYPQMNLLDNPYDSKVKTVTLYPTGSSTGWDIVEFQCILSSQD